MQALSTLEEPAAKVPFQVTSIGVSAFPALACQGKLGQAWAVFRRSCYLETLNGELLCVADQALGRAGRSLISPAWL